MKRTAAMNACPRDARSANHVAPRSLETPQATLGSPNEPDAIVGHCERFCGMPEIAAEKLPILVFVVPGTPRGKGRARACRRGGRIWHYTPPATRAYESQIAVAALAARPPCWPLDAYYGIVVEITGGRSDNDNIEKAVCDGAQNVLWHNDKRVIETHTKRHPKTRHNAAQLKVTAWVLPAPALSSPQSAGRARTTP